MPDSFDWMIKPPNGNPIKGEIEDADRLDYGEVSSIIYPKFDLNKWMGTIITIRSITTDGWMVKKNATFILDQWIIE